MMRRTALCVILSLFSATNPVASATDWLVDDDGGSGVFTTIGAAMAAAVPNDRILVRPGSYPAFQHSVAVDVIGLGTDPSQVRVARVDYHVSIPALGYDTLLCNMTVGGDNPADSVAITGNEIPPGTLHIDGVVIDGSVFLGGGSTGFYLLVTNSSIHNHAGEGVFGDAMAVGGVNNFVELRDSIIVGADATSTLPASSGLRLFAGTRARIINTRVHGGSGSGTIGLSNGASAVIHGVAPGAVMLRLDGGSLITGGDAVNNGAGGHGIDLSGSVELGNATVTAGAGSPPGLAYTAAAPALLPADVHLSALPLLTDAQQTVAVEPGNPISFHMNTPSATTAMFLSFDVDVPDGDGFLAANTAPLFWIPGNSYSAIIPIVPGLDFTGLEVYAQGLTLLPSGQIAFSDTASLRIDWAP